MHICGGIPLSGEVRVQGSKNAVLPILAAAVLVDGVVTLTNCPRIADVECMVRLLKSVGCHVEWKGGRIRIDARRAFGDSLPAKYVTQMRCSVIMIGAVLGRNKRISINYPGGCVIGKRPIDMHLQALARMGVSLTEKNNRLTACTENLCGSEISLPFPSVGATENTILAGVLAEGETVIRGGAMEPEIQALCRFLICAGADIRREETEGTIRIRGVERLHSCTYEIPFDRIVAGTYLLGCMAAGGSIVLDGVDMSQLTAVMTVIDKMGGGWECQNGRVALEAPDRPKAIPYLKTEVYPGYPTDLQSQLLAVLALAEGKSVVEESIFENRFRVVPQLHKMGADIHIEGNRAVVQGTEGLRGACVKAQELRGGAALCIAALAAKGETRIGNRHFIDRGYEALERDIRSLGGRI
ncbi:MAG TPA: UDP-N-acetylglucosamine 1-carboxyvinyltransferase [Lachnospiraceae bacterium]|nr:UDP-N-acetylglucosamine 1-carboxyvinyltransferase [Lachnospiraceae bacterium]